MGELANAVARLEEQVEDVRELRKIVERFDMEIAARMEEIETIGGAILDLHAISTTRSPSTTTWPLNSPPHPCEDW